jgi:hypothetical protein
MPMIAWVCHHLCCSQVEKSCWCLPFATADFHLLHLPLYCVLTCASDDKGVFRYYAAGLRCQNDLRPATSARTDNALQFLLHLFCGAVRWTLSSAEESQGIRTCVYAGA